MDRKRADEVTKDLVTSMQCWALRSIADWQTNCNNSGVYRDEALMFKITQNTINGFTLAEILLMAAMNEIETKRKASSAVNNPERKNYEGR
jgi:hypothetical protein